MTEITNYILAVGKIHRKKEIHKRQNLQTNKQTKSANLSK